ncbi:putative ATP/GTP-binding protein [Pseudomonas cannabina]|nr:putative ATP/GTP-binding protein [Pseudomonas cannabina]
MMTASSRTCWLKCRHAVCSTACIFTVTAITSLFCLKAWPNATLFKSGCVATRRSTASARCSVLATALLTWASWMSATGGRRLPAVSWRKCLSELRMSDPVHGLETVGSGSYLKDDVHFLLRSIEMQTTSVEEKERLIQTRQKHYSEMISEESAPSDAHKALYERALSQNGARMATDVHALAQALDRQCTRSEIVLVSFVRAGLPLGVLLRRALIDLGREAHHYGISIVRDRGIDKVALEAIIQTHGAQNIVFVDGWTGKGAISGEIRRSMAGDARFPQNPRLVVLADPCGSAWLAASAEDWVIPSGILGATVSGLVSRSIWPADGGLHGCVVYEHLQDHDVTRSFIEQIERQRRQKCSTLMLNPWTPTQRLELKSAASRVIDSLAERFGVNNLNRVKPGIAEATRAVMRRVPDHVLVRNLTDGDVQLLLHLTEKAGIPVEEVGDALGPYRAVTIIRSLS